MKEGQHINSVNNKLLLINSRMFSKRFDYNVIFGIKYKEVE